MLNTKKKFDWLGKKSLDIYIPELKLAIEYDGIYYHKFCKENDSEKNEICKANGIDIVRIREENTDKSACDENVFFYINDRDYSNINIPIEFLYSYIFRKYGILIENDIDVKRDHKEIVTYIQNKYYKKTVAYAWPEVIDYWDDSASVYDVFCSDNKGCYDLRCPHCGTSFRLSMQYHHKRKSLIPCECEMLEISSQMEEVTKNYIEDNMLVSFDDSLQSRRLYDRMEMEIEWWIYISDKTYQELEMYKKLGFESPLLDYFLSKN